MNIDLENPFGVTKATEFSDKEIDIYWVDFLNNNHSIFELLNPKELMPKFILGSKGCGKTHLLRYYSYTLQKIRIPDTRELLISDQYIGIYAVFGGINSSRFMGKRISEDQWEKIFEYYLEIYLSSKLLDVVEDLFESLEIPKPQLKELFAKLSNIVSIEDEEVKFECIPDVIDFLGKIRRNIDFIVNNAALTNHVDISSITVQFNPGDLIFGIPEIISIVLTEFKDVKIVYILDELEKFNESQKRYINTLVWDKRYPCTFWIGARNYGYTTNQTRTQETLRNGSEFELLQLDEIKRKNEQQYMSFAQELCFKRIADYLHKSKKKINNDDISNSLKAFFEEADEKDIIKIISLKFTDKEYPHIKTLRRKLKDGLKKHIVKAGNGYDEDQVIKKIIYKENPILEKCKVFFFYQLWSDGIEIKEASEIVSQEFKNYLSGKNSKFDNIIEKYKKDLIAQLLLETDNRTIFFSGIDDLIDISWGNPRSFLVILKKIYQCSLFNGEAPFIKGKISVKSQNTGILEASRWFYEDAEVIGEENKFLYTCIHNLGQYLSGIRFSDKPSETSPSSFSIKLNDISPIATRLLDLAVDHSFVIKIENGRKDKNSDRTDNLYQINRMLAPLYSLPVARRGVVNFTRELAEVIFNPERHQDFNKVYKEAIEKMTAPEFGKRRNKSNNSGNQLFNDIEV